MVYLVFYKYTVGSQYCTRNYSPYLGSQYSSQYTHTHVDTKKSVPTSTVSVEARVKRTKCIFRLVDRKDRKLS